MMSALTAEKILDVAQRLIQTRGYNGFSFRDIGEAIGIKSASIHYHFASKADLGTALVTRYRETFTKELAAIESQHETAPKRLKAFIDLFRRSLKDDRLCLCGMLGAERDSLPESLNVQVQEFFSFCEDWLVAVLKQGRSAAQIEFRGTPQAMADHLLALLEGAVLMARSFEDTERFDKAAGSFLRVLKPASDA